MAKKIVTLYVDDTGIRVLSTDGKTVGQWAYATLEPGLIQGGVVADEEKVAARLRRLLEDKQIEEKKVIVGLSGLHSLTLVVNLPQVPEAVLAEAVTRETARILPVPLEQLYMTWQTIPAETKRIRAFVIAIPRNAVDSLLKTIHRAGLIPLQMEIKPLALVRLVNEPNAVVLDVQENEFDIVIFGNGIPQPIRTIVIPAKGLSWQEKLPMIRDDLLRTMEFYDSKNPENPLVPSVPLYISGDLADEPEICETLSNELGRSVMALSSPVRHPSGLVPSRYVVNIGLAAKKIPPKTKPVSLVSRVDALPPAYQPKSFSWARVAVVTGVALGIALIGAQAGLIQMSSSAIDASRVELETFTKITAQSEVQRQEITTALAQAESSRDIFAEAVGTLEGQRSEFNGSLRLAATSLPANVSLSSIIHDGDSILVEVQSPSETQVLGYARFLEASGEFARVSIVRMRRIEGEDMTFILIAELKR